MLRELTNLLPEERRHAHAQEYLLRLVTIAAFTLSVVMIAHGALLVPSYLYLHDQISVRQERLQALSQERAASGYEDLASRIKSLSDNANVLIALQSVPSGSDTIRTLLALPHPGIKLYSFTFAPDKSGAGRMTLTGSSATRESLRSFDIALKSLPFVKSSDLPLSTYAKDSDIPFTDTLTLKFAP